MSCLNNLDQQTLKLLTVALFLTVFCKKDKFDWFKRLFVIYFANKANKQCFVYAIASLSFNTSIFGSIFHIYILTHYILILTY